MSSLTKVTLLVCGVLFCLSLRLHGADVIISEILYSADPTNLGGEFIEIHNKGTEAVDVSGWVITSAVEFTFPGSTSISPGEYVLVARNQADAENYYGVTVLGEFQGALSNGGDTILIQDDSLPRQVMDVVVYDDETPWPADADGGGVSLELLGLDLDNGLAENWALGQPFSPGAENQTGFQGENGSLVINEIMYKPRREEQREKFDRVNQGFYMEDSDDEFGEYVELLNVTDETVDLSGWSFTNGIGYTFPEGASVEAGAYIVVAADPDMTQRRHGIDAARVFGPFGFGEINDGGERLTLRDAASMVVDTVNFNDSTPWPTGPDALGYSLELLDPLSDNSSAANWRASTAEFPFPEITFIEEEGGGDDGWRFFTITGEATSNRLYFLLPEPGEWIVDEFSLRPAGGDDELIVNGSFDANDEGWQRVGNHETSFWAATEDRDGGGAEHVVSTGKGSNLLNCLLMRRIEGVGAGQSYDLSFWYKYVSGSRSAIVRLAGGGLETTLLVGGNSSDVSLDFSDGVNPIGFWTFADADGDALLGRSDNWLAPILGDGQPAWTPTVEDGAVSDNLTPGWCRSIGGAPTGDFPTGAVGTHGPSQLIWTAPSLGRVTITGGLYLMNRVENGDQLWTMRVNNRIVTSGELLWTEDEFNSSSPKPLSTGTGGAEALEQVLEDGDELTISIEARAGSSNGFVIFDVQSAFQRGIAPKPPLVGTLGTGSPARMNSRESKGLPPFVRELRHLIEKPRSSDDVPVVTRIVSEEPIQTVELFYRLNIEETAQSIAMLDDGTQQDGAAGDGVYGAIIPAQASQNMVHYWVEVEDTGGASTTYPFDDDVSNTQAYFQFDDEIDTVLTTYHLWITNQNLQLIRGNARSSEYKNAHLAINGVAYPNIGARFRGRGSRTHAKNQWKFQFHKSQPYKGNRTLDTMVNQPLNQQIVFDIMAASGVSNIDSELVRLHHNGPYWGVYVVFESPNSTWLRKYSFHPETEVYKARSVETPGEVKNSDLYPNQLVTDIDFWGAWNKKIRPLQRPIHIRDLTAKVNDLSEEELLPWVDQNVDLHQWFGRWALYILTNTDDFAGHNFYLMLPGGPGGKWQNLAYDFDSSYTYSRVGPIGPFYGNGIGGSAAWQRNRFLRRVSGNPTLSRIYRFRLRDMLEFYQEADLFPPVQALFDATGTERNTERVKTMKGSLSEFTSVFRGQRARVVTEVNSRNLPGDDEIPVPTPAAGSFSGSILVSLTAPERWLPVYTLDGSDPRLSSTSFEYEQPIELTVTTTIRAASIRLHRDTGEPLYSVGDWTEVGDHLFEQSVGGSVGPFVRGDCNGDGVSGGDVSDAVSMLVFVLLGGTVPSCQAACDADASSVIDVGDALYILGHSYLGSAAPPAPYPGCGTSDLEGDMLLGCDSAPACVTP